jgi:hypothetical protein
MKRISRGSGVLLRPLSWKDSLFRLKPKATNNENEERFDSKSLAFATS